MDRWWEDYRMGEGGITSGIIWFSEFRYRSVEVEPAFRYSRIWGRLGVSVQKQVLLKYSSLAEEQDNLECWSFGACWKKVGTEARKSKICVHEKTGFIRIWWKKQGYREIFQRFLGFPGIYRDENTENRSFCAENCQKNHVCQRKLMRLIGWQGREFINILLLYRKSTG